MDTSEDKYARIQPTMPEQLLDRLDKYCNSVMRGKPKIRNLVIGNAIEEFLDRQEGKKVENRGSSY